MQRVLGFTRWLPEHGWDCTVVCAGPEDYWVRDDTLERQVPPETEVIRVRGGSALSAWLRLRGGGGGGGRRSGPVFHGLRSLADWWLLPDSYVGWAARARRVAAARLARGDVSVVLSSSPPDSVHLAARPLARRFRLPWVADFRDPWIGLHRRRPPSGWHAARQRGMERGVLSAADLVLVTSRTHAAALADDPAAAGRRVEFLPNGFEPGAGGVEAARDPEHFLIAFTGTLTLTPDVETLLEALHELLARRPEARRRIRARLAGAYQEEYLDRALALGLKGIVDFPGPVTHAEARALQRAADALVVWKPVGCDAAIPAKVYEYLDTGRPILALLPDDEAGRLVSAAGGRRVPPGDRSALAAEIESLYLAWREGRAAPPAPPPAWLAGHSRERLAGRLAGLLDGLAERGPTARPATGGEGGAR